MKYVLTCVVVILYAQYVVAGKIDREITGYFNSETVNNYHRTWQKVRRSFENAVALALKEAFGADTQNVLLIGKRSPQLAQAYFLSDHVVDLLLTNLTMKYHIPRLRPFPPDVNLALCDNIIRVHADLDQIFVEADYLLFRNRSDILFEQLEDPYKESPFSYQQVQKQGSVMVVANDCKLVGMAIATLEGLSVSIGYSSFQVTRCQFRIEIHSPGFGLPPVMVPYFSTEQGHLFERLLSKPIAAELNPKLQGIIFSLINTTAVLEGNNVVAVRNYQHEIMAMSHDYVRSVVNAMNDVTSMQSGGFIPLSDLTLFWDDAHGHEYPAENNVALQGMTLNGLETAYCAQVGGPYKATAVKIVDEIRFQELQVRGKMTFENTTFKEVKDFTVELLDVAVSVKMNVEYVPDKNGQAEALRQDSRGHSLEVIGWRDLEYYVAGEKGPIHYLVVGYIIDEVPKVMLQYLDRIFGEAVRKADNTFGSKGVEDKFGDNDNHMVKKLKLQENDLAIVDQSRDIAEVGETEEVGKADAVAEAAEAEEVAKADAVAEAAEAEEVANVDAVAEAAEADEMAKADAVAEATEAEEADNVAEAAEAEEVVQADAVAEAAQAEDVETVNAVSEAAEEENGDEAAEIIEAIPEQVDAENEEVAAQGGNGEEVGNREEADLGVGNVENYEADAETGDAIHEEIEAVADEEEGGEANVEAEVGKVEKADEPTAVDNSASNNSIKKAARTLEKKKYNTPTNAIRESKKRNK